MWLLGESSEIIQQPHTFLWNFTTMDEIMMTWFAPMTSPDNS